VGDGFMVERIQPRLDHQVTGSVAVDLVRAQASTIDAVFVRFVQILVPDVQTIFFRRMDTKGLIKPGQPSALSQLP
jgi:hypothetical protein